MARLAIVALLAVAPFVGLIAGLEIDRRRAVERDHANAAGEIANFAASRTSGLFGSTVDTLGIIATFPSIRDKNYAHCNRVLAAMREPLKRYTALVVIDAKGALLCGAPARPAPTTFTDQPWFKRALANDALLIGDVMTGPISGLRTLPVTYGFRVDGGSERLIAAAGLSLSSLQDHLASLPRPPAARLLAFDSGGAITAAAPALDGLGQDLIDLLRPLARAGRRRPIDVVYRIRTAHGNVRWIWERAEPMLDIGGAFTGYEGIISDITDRKRVEQDMIERHRDLSLHYGQLLDAIASLAEARDPYTAGHQRRVASLAVAIATELDLPAHRIDGLALAARIHDVGKLGVPTDILAKPTRLTESEFAIVKQHVQVGYDALKDIEFPWPIAQIVLQHHERMDGSGYPHGITGDRMLPEARILAVADVVESMASHRPYRPARVAAEVKAELERGRGRLYDADAVGVALRFLGDGDLHLDDPVEAPMPAMPPLDFGEARARREHADALLKPDT